MSSSGSLKRISVGIAGLIALPILLIGGLLILDQIPYSAALPPANLKTLEEFQRWRLGNILGEGTFTKSGVTYTVMLAPAGRYLASGPSAYLFDQQGKYVDWTDDMGDFYTDKNHFDLSSGNVKNIKWKR